MKTLRRWQSTLLSDLFLFKRWGITRQKATKWIIQPLRKVQTVQICCSAFQQMGNPRVVVVHISNTPFFVTWLKQKVPCHSFFSVHNKKCNVIMTRSHFCGLKLWPRVIVSMDSVVYSAVSKEFNPQRPKAVSCTHFELAGWKTTSHNRVLFSILCGMHCMRKAEKPLNQISHRTPQEACFEANAVWQQWLPNLSIDIILLHCWWCLQGRYLLMYHEYLLNVMRLSAVIQIAVNEHFRHPSICFFFSGPVMLSVYPISSNCFWRLRFAFCQMDSQNFKDIEYRVQQQQQIQRG